MCQCTPEIRTPFCGKPGCEWPEQIGEERMNTVTIYEGSDACKKCLGWKRVADSDDGESWKYWAELPAASAIAVTLGIVKPVECPRCKGTGKDPEVASQ